MISQYSKLFIFTTAFILMNINAVAQKGNVVVWSSPEGEILSDKYKVSVSGKELPVYMAKVAPESRELRAKVMDDKVNSAKYCDTAAFTYFDMTGKVVVNVTVPGKVNSVKILPSSAGIEASIMGNSVSFSLSTPKHLTVEINGDWLKSLHIFANPPEIDAPKPDDPDVIYFGPGIHKVSTMVIGDNKTVYIAGGAIVRAVIDSTERYSTNKTTGLRGYSPTFDLRGKNITIRGRGIIDAGGCTTHARNMIAVRNCSNVTLEGIILRDASLWTVPIRQSDNVTVKNIKLIGYRANSDGIDICNSREVLVENCFIRTLDDLIVIKTDRGRGEAKNITARGCVLWNEVAHALSIGAELRENVDNVLFADCDVIHDKGREWALRIFHSDSALISNVRFENIRLEETKRFISLWINRSVWSLDKDQRGQIKGVIFKDIKAEGDPATIAFVGFDENHAVEDVLLENVVVNSKPVTREMVQMNSFVRNVNIKP